MITDPEYPYQPVVISSATTSPIEARPATFDLHGECKAENADLRVQLRRAEAVILAHVQLSGKTAVETERRIAAAFEAALSAVESEPGASGRIWRLIHPGLFVGTITETSERRILQMAVDRVRSARADTGATDG